MYDVSIHGDCLDEEQAALFELVRGFIEDQDFHDDQNNGSRVRRYLFPSFSIGVFRTVDCNFHEQYTPRSFCKSILRLCGALEQVPDCMKGLHTAMYLYGTSQVEGVVGLAMAVPSYQAAVGAANGGLLGSFGEGHFLPSRSVSVMALLLGKACDEVSWHSRAAYVQDRIGSSASVDKIRYMGSKSGIVMESVVMGAIKGLWRSFEWECGVDAHLIGHSDHDAVKTTSVSASVALGICIDGSFAEEFTSSVVLPKNYTDLARHTFDSASRMDSVVADMCKLEHVAAWHDGSGMLDFTGYAARVSKKNAAWSHEYVAWLGSSIEYTPLNFISDGVVKLAVPGDKVWEDRLAMRGNTFVATKLALPVAIPKLPELADDAKYGAVADDALLAAYNAMAGSTLINFASAPLRADNVTVTGVIADEKVVETKEDDRELGEIKLLVEETDYGIPNVMFVSPAYVRPEDSSRYALATVIKEQSTSAAGAISRNLADVRSKRAGGKNFSRTFYEFEEMETVAEDLGYSLFGVEPVEHDPGRVALTHPPKGDGVLLGVIKRQGCWAPLTYEATSDSDARMCI
jgi:hypothetical protein